MAGGINDAPQPAIAPHEERYMIANAHEARMVDWWWQFERYLERYFERHHPLVDATPKGVRGLIRQQWAAQAALDRQMAVLDALEAYDRLPIVQRARKENDRREAAHRAHPRAAVLGGRQGVPNGAECLAGWDFT